MFPKAGVSKICVDVKIKNNYNELIMENKGKCKERVLIALYLLQTWHFQSRHAVKLISRKKQLSKL